MTRHQVHPDFPVFTIRVTRDSVKARLHKGISDLDDVDWEKIWDRTDGLIEDLLFRVLSADEGEGRAS